MRTFVEQCRREWRRLGVDDAVADEMAADLTSDLDEAGAEGISAADYLGASASDPRTFAAAWATERGIIPTPRVGEPGRRMPRVLGAFTGLATFAVIGAVLLLATGEPKVSLDARNAAASAATVHRIQTAAAAPIEWILLVVALAALGFSGWLWLRWRREPS